MVPGVTSTLAAAQSPAVGQIIAECLKHQFREMQSSEENVDIIRESRSRCIKYKPLQGMAPTECLPSTCLLACLLA